MQQPAAGKWQSIIRAVTSETYSLDAVIVKSWLVTRTGVKIIVCLCTVVAAVNLAATASVLMLTIVPQGRST